MASAIHSLHTLVPPVIHRDIKPDNICIDDDGALVFVDFGASRQCEDGTTCRTDVGTEQYMAPEVRQGRNYNRTSEVFSLGAVFAELFTTMSGYDVRTGLHAVLRNQPFSNCVPRTLKWLKKIKPTDGSLDAHLDLIAKMFETKPLDRPALWEVHRDLLRLQSVFASEFACCAGELSFEDDNVSDLSTPPSEDLDDIVAYARRLSFRE
ncbi:kinase-like domain-containing protein [Fimicolochytrium jonesii]|uniref:kinase-like domain-containing protein n=1 Tax=Fimicolochytrium jonesii TaxID=1396493 RepID=UPI0022FEDE5F|nr:kinase-like domain-containing protein [Fimicolochytrium jonesii]KAI8821999.1 kinase-like domain-containing protein [Fimicolochytrium jonesii]